MTGKIHPAKAAVPTREEIQKSAALSIILNPPQSFKGRKVGALVTNGTDAKLVAALKSELETEGATLEIIAPTIGGVELSDGSPLKADHKIGGGPSVLFDAIALLVSAEGVGHLLKNAAAVEFAADAFAHLKVIGWIPAAMPLMEKAGFAQAIDDACVEFINTKSVESFIGACRKLRFWDREQVVTF